MSRHWEYLDNSMCVSPRPSKKTLSKKQWQRCKCSSAVVAILQLPDGQGGMTRRSWSGACTQKAEETECEIKCSEDRGRSSAQKRQCSSTTRISSARQGCQQHSERTFWAETSRVFKSYPMMNMTKTCQWQWLLEGKLQDVNPNNLLLPTHSSYYVAPALR